MVQKVDTPLPADRQMPHWFWQVYNRVNSSVIDGTFTSAVTITATAPALTITSSALLLKLTTTTARGSGNNYIEFYDPTGIKGHLGYGSAASDVFNLYQGMNANIEVYTNAIKRLILAAAGNLTVNAPSSGVALTVNGVTGATGAITVTDGTVTSVWQPNNTSIAHIGTTSNHAFNVMTNNATKLSIAAAGNVTINAPSSGDALTVSASGNDTAVGSFEHSGFNGRYFALPARLTAGAAGTGYPIIGYNARPYAAPDVKYITSDTATYIQFQQEQFDFYSAASGTAGNSISATRNMRLALKYFLGNNVTVANLVAAGTAGAGARAFVTDATATTFASVVAGGGANNVPVYSDGTNWRIG